MLLLHSAGEKISAEQLPDLTQELLLLAEDALLQRDWARCEAYLAAVFDQNLRWHYLMAQLHFAQKDFAAARPHFEAAWDISPKACCSRLEDCCRETEDFAGAYFYACKLRDFTKI